MRRQESMPRSVILWLDFWLEIFFDSSWRHSSVQNWAERFRKMWVYRYRYLVPANNRTKRGYKAARRMLSSGRAVNLRLCRCKTGWWIPFTIRAGTPCICLQSRPVWHDCRQGWTRRAVPSASLEYSSSVWIVLVGRESFHHDEPRSE